MSCLPLLFDQRDGLGTGVRNRPENVPPASSHIELLLEKHGNGDVGINSEWRTWEHAVLSQFLLFAQFLNQTTLIWTLFFPREPSDFPLRESSI